MASSQDSLNKAAYDQRLSDVAEEPKKMLLPIEGYEKMPLVPLEQAVKSVIDIFPNIKEKIYTAKYNYEETEDGLTLDESAAISLYTMTSFNDEPVYRVLNSTLRSDKPDRCDKLKPWFSYLKLFITALAHIPSYRGTVYRGVKLNLSDRYPTGKKFVWWGFSSCTKLISVLQSELFLGGTGTGTLFIIECYSGKDIHYHSHYPTEDEILLVAARQLEVVSRLNPAPNLWIIHVKEIEPPFPFLKIDSGISSTFELLTGDTKTCPSCLKTISKPSTSDAQKTTDDLQGNVKLKKETVICSKPEKISSSEELVVDDSTLVNAVESIVSVSTTDDIVSSEVKSLVENVDDPKKSQSEELINSSVLPESTPINSSPSNDSIFTTTMDYQGTEVLDGHPNSTESCRTQRPIDDDRLINHKLDVIDRQSTQICFKNESITPESAEILAGIVRENTELNTLYLFNNGLGDHGLYYLVQALLFRPPLKTLRVTKNKITDVGAAHVAEVLANAPRTLTRLYLDQNQITDQGVKIIIQAYRQCSNSSLQSLSFALNPLVGDGCVDCVIRMILETHSLKFLYLEKCSLSEDGKERLRKAIDTRQGFTLQM
ncbi:unnamed protein product [Sphagnum troendelagicum]|uniref:NAD(P)(+)--arginine ADP-ribosyltransferase n=1 Tax=Sphagnum troendelagicum TaxID=128251 RepID=A0ABP0T793_9BRYO